MFSMIYARAQAVCVREVLTLVAVLAIFDGCGLTASDAV